MPNTAPCGAYTAPRPASYTNGRGGKRRGREEVRGEGEARSVKEIGKD